MKYIIFFIFVLSSFLGCFPYETARLAGIGVKPFKTKGKIYSQNFKKDIIKCYHQTEEIIKELGANLYRGSSRKSFIVSFGYSEVFPSANHSTEVAIFFNWLDVNKTEVQISSLNYNLAKFVSKKIFSSLQDQSGQN
ncbi:MAG: hypothetical protein K9L87_03420 [Candidatus Omnitrophica bacterium]|nr:hypothetical protein [Candidatus Omnitrophota bacterium]MCF7892127.1 hypothetical protein [Candidatus Omnitrophota bacterium]MCF7897781.1 hypothetical protein [Candidatus Omnitrophota bacterium]MCF7909193.1 hypothetical protein [Candidatus Omnitrophota bacterium]